MHVEWYIQARTYRLGGLLQVRQTSVAPESSPAAVYVAVVMMAAAAYSPHQMAPLCVCVCVCERERFAVIM